MAELFKAKPSAPRLPMFSVVFGQPERPGWFLMTSRKTGTARSVWFQSEDDGRSWITKRPDLDPTCRLQRYEKWDDVLRAGRSLKSVQCAEVALHFDSKDGGVIPIDEFIAHVAKIIKALKDAGLDKPPDPAKFMAALKSAGLDEMASYEDMAEAIEAVGLDKLRPDHDSDEPIKTFNLNCNTDGCAERYAAVSLFHVTHIDLVLENVCARCNNGNQLKYKASPKVLGGSLKPLKAIAGPLEPNVKEIGCSTCAELLIRFTLALGASTAGGVKLDLRCAQCGTEAGYEGQLK